MQYLLLFFEFFKTGLFSVGGGLATLPFLYNLSDQYGWFTRAELADMIAISESTPGPIGVNMATYAGFKAGGSFGASMFGDWGFYPGAVIGGLVSTIALVLPSIIVIVIIAKFLQKFQQNKFVQSAFYGLRPAVTALIAVACFEVIKISLFRLDTFTWSALFRDWNLLRYLNLPAIVLFALAFILYRKCKGHPIIYIAGGAIAGILMSLSPYTALG